VVKGTTSEAAVVIVKKKKSSNIGIIGTLSAGEHYLRGFLIFLWRRS
jgi:hypothetical protein